MGKVSSVSLIDSQWVSTCRSRRELLHSALICQPFLASESVDQICSACTIIFIQHKLLKQSNILKTKHGSTNTLIMSTAISHCQQHLLLHSHCVVVWERCLVLFLDGRGAKHYRKECKVECCLKARLLRVGMSCPFHNWLWSYVFRFTKISHWSMQGCSFTL